MIHDLFLVGGGRSTSGVASLFTWGNLHKTSRHCEVQLVLGDAQKRAITAFEEALQLPSGYNLGCSPLPPTVTSRNIAILLGGPPKKTFDSFAMVTGRGNIPSCKNEN